MKTYILVGEEVIKDFQYKEWEDFEQGILKDFTGDIIAWDKEKDRVATLLDMLEGWNDFIELSKEDLEEIEQNTDIEIEWD